MDNKLFEYRDLRTVKRSPYFRSMMEFIDRMTQEGIACTTRGTLKSSNLNDKTKWRRHTMHYLRAWEYVSLLEGLQIPDGASIFDVGGAATPFLFYLADVKKCKIITVDLQRELVEHTRAVAAQKNWDIKAFCCDIAEFVTGQVFDYAVSVSVVEHMTPEVKQATAMKMAGFLKPEGRIGLTFDYGVLENLNRNDSGEVYLTVKSMEEIQNFFIAPSGCLLEGKSRLAQAYQDDPVTVKKRFRNAVFLSYFPPQNRVLRSFFYQPLGHTYGLLFLKKKAPIQEEVHEPV